MTLNEDILFNIFSGMVCKYLYFILSIKYISHSVKKHFRLFLFMIDQWQYANIIVVKIEVA